MAEHPPEHRSETVILASSEPLKAVDVTDNLARVGAYAVRFATEEEKDLAGEYFTKSTWFGKNDGNGADVLLNHGEPLGESDFLKGLADYVFESAKSIKDDIGIFMETVLDLSDDFQKAVFELVQKGKLSWSTGSASHVVKKAPDGEIKRWPIVEVSFTPTPCEPRLPAIQPLKSVVFDEVAKAELVAALHPEDPIAPIHVDIPAQATAKSNLPNPKTMSDEIKPETKTEPAPRIDINEERKKWQIADTERKTAIRTEAKRFANFGGVELAEKAIDEGTSVEDFRKSLIASFNPEAVRVTPSDARQGKVEAENPSMKSVGAAFVENDEYKRAAKSGSIGNMRSVHVELPNIKATLLTSTGPFTSYDRPPGVIQLEQQRLTVRDLMSQGTTNANSIRYVQEDTYTNAATTVAEEGAKPEASFDLSEVDAPIRKIAVIGRVSDESFADFPFLQTYVDSRLRFMLKEREEAQILNGNGSGSNLTGILQTSGIQTQAVGTDKKGIAIFKAMTKVRATGHFEPDGIVIHPTDYQTLRIDADSNNQFYGGGYFYAPYGNGMVNGGIMPLWGLPCVVTTAITQGTALIGAFKLGAMIVDRLGVTVDTTNSDASDFAYNRIAIRVEERLGLPVWRPLAFCKVTGL